MGGGVRGRRQSCRCFVVRGVALLVHSCSMERALHARRLLVLHLEG
jgi:hypothetical protein